MDFLSGPGFGAHWGPPKQKDQIEEASEVKFETMVYPYVKNLSIKVKFPSGKKLRALGGPNRAPKSTDQTMWTNYLQIWATYVHFSEE